MWKWFKWVLLGVIFCSAVYLIYANIMKSRQNENEIPRIPSQTCPDKEFEGQGDGALFYKGEKYYTESEDWDWTVANCPDYYIYK